MDSIFEGGGEVTGAWGVVFGLETELGIAVAEVPEADVVEESIRLVRSAAPAGVGGVWDYRQEDPHQDARGFRAAELRQDTDESQFFSLDQQRPYTFEEVKSDVVLFNGGRFYNDHTHPEYSSPECGTLAELVLHDLAGERLAEDCARWCSQPGRTVRLFKNNTDFRGHSYGCHENYLVGRGVPWEQLVQGMLPFLVTRQIYAGAGKVGWEREDHGELRGGFQISQRADFFSELVGIDTMNRRPLINSRDEPHAERSRYRRFHVILGDSNLSPHATWLKVGTTALMLLALQESPLPAEFALADPVHTHQMISRDATFGWHVPLRNGRASTACEVQWGLLGWVRDRLPLDHPEQRAVVEVWQRTVEALSREPLAWRGRLDWVEKYHLLETFREAEGVDWEDAWMQSLDLQYHDLDRENGLAHAVDWEPWQHLLQEHAAVSPREALRLPPRSSRAYVRGRVMQRFAEAVVRASWEGVVLRVDGELRRVSFGTAFARGALESLVRAVDEAGDVREFVAKAALATG